MAIFIILFSMIGAFYAAYTRHKRHSKRIQSLEKRLNYGPPVIDFEYQRFNTRSKRETSISIEEEFIFDTDIQNISVGHETLMVLISSEVNDITFKFELVVQPFDKVLLEHDGFTNYNQEGVIILWSLGVQTKHLFTADEKLNELYPNVTNDPGGVRLNIDSYQLDPAQSTILFHGKFKDQNEFKVRLDYKAYRLQLVAPADSVRNKSNFPNFSDDSSD